ncbi:hypothetical protein JXA47_06300 [Candidatus Sumerlaeota bacterium]|nr:hypothetical protein [Candidatus Sumerlaeota bacterium]
MTSQSRRGHLLLAAICLCLLAVALPGQIPHPTALERALDGDPPLITVPSQFPTIQSAIDAASPETRILIASGEYEESLVISDRILSLEDDGSGPPRIAGAIGISASSEVSLLGIMAENVTVDGSTVTIEGCTLVAPPSTSTGVDGKSAVEATDGSLVVIRSSHLTGGDGGPGRPGYEWYIFDPPAPPIIVPPVNGGNGGHGVKACTLCRALLEDVEIVPGDGGPGAGAGSLAAYPGESGSGIGDSMGIGDGGTAFFRVSRAQSTSETPVFFLNGSVGVVEPPRAAEFLLGSETPTDIESELQDTNGDGVFDAADIVRAQRFIEERWDH